MSQVIQKITDYEDAAVELLLSQFKDSDKFPKLVKALVAPLQGLEDAGYPLLSSHALNSAVGAQLDTVADYFGVVRDGADDTTLRQRVRDRLYQLTTSGTVDDLSEILKQVTGADAVDYFPQYPAAFGLYMENGGFGVGLRAFMLKFVDAGVNIWILASYGTLPFGFSSDYGQGFYLVGDSYVMLLDGELLGFSANEDAAPGTGTFCDMAPDGTVIPYPESGAMVDIFTA